MSDSDWVDDPHEGDWVDDNHASKEERPWYSVSGEGLVRGAIDAIPIVGGIGGGLLGTPVAGPVGSVGGAGMGYAGGKELADILKNRLLGDKATSVNPIEQAKRVAGNLTEGATMEMGGQLAGKAISAAGPAIKNTIDDVASAPLGQDGPRGMIASGLDKIHRAGKSANKIIGDAIDAVTPQTGDKGADGLIKAATRIGRYNPVTAKIQGALDTAEFAPKGAQWAASKLSPLIDKLSGGGAYATELAQRSPLVYKSLTGKMNEVAKEDKQSPPSTEDLLQKTKGTKYASVLQNASKRGPEAIRAASFVLQSTDPEYRKLTVGDQDQAPEDSDYDDFEDTNEHQRL